MATSHESHVKQLSVSSVSANLQIAAACLSCVSSLTWATPDVLPNVSRSWKGTPCCLAGRGHTVDGHGPSEVSAVGVRMESITNTYLKTNPSDKTWSG